MINYQELNDFKRPDIIALYRSVGWQSYTNYPEKLEKALNNSLCTYAAYLNDELVGLIRVVGDGETIIYIQDILVQPKVQHQGIGKNLMSYVLKKYHHVRQKVLLTDDTSKTKNFYLAMGFLESSYLDLLCFYKQES